MMPRQREHLELVAHALLEARLADYRANVLNLADRIGVDSANQLRNLLAEQEARLRNAGLTVRDYAQARAVLEALDADSAGADPLAELERTGHPAMALVVLPCDPQQGARLAGRLRAALSDSPDGSYVSALYGPPGELRAMLTGTIVDHAQQTAKTDADARALAGIALDSTARALAQAREEVDGMHRLLAGLAEEAGGTLTIPLAVLERLPRSPVLEVLDDPAVDARRIRVVP